MANGDQDHRFTAPTWEEYKTSFPKGVRKLACLLWPWWLALQVCAIYSQSSLATVLRILEPIGIAIAVVALIVTLVELPKDRAIRAATLYTMMLERIDKARASDRAYQTQMKVAVTPDRLGAPDYRVNKQNYSYKEGRSTLSVDFLAQARTKGKGEY